MGYVKRMISHADLENDPLNYWNWLNRATTFNHGDVWFSFHSCLSGDVIIAKHS